MAIARQFPFRQDDVIQHCSKTGDRYVVRLVDDEVYEAFAENLDGVYGTRVINPDNWVKVGILHKGEIR